MVSAQKSTVSFGVGAKYAFRKMLNLPVTAYTSRRSNNVRTASKTFSRCARCYCTAPTARTRRICGAHIARIQRNPGAHSVRYGFFNFILYFVCNTFVANVATYLDCLKQCVITCITINTYRIHYLKIQDLHAAR